MEEESLHFDITLTKIQFIFRLTGIYIRSGVRNAPNRFKSRILYILNFLNNSQTLLGCIIWCIHGARNGMGFLEQTFNAPCIVISILAQFKGGSLIRNEEFVSRLITKLRELEMKARERPQSQAKDKIVKQELKFLNFVLDIQNIAYAIMITAFAIGPLVIIGVRYYQTKKIRLELPFLIWYPFNPFQIEVWPFLYFLQCWSESIISLNICAADYFFFTCCTYIRIQFRLLQCDLENMIPVENCNKKFFEDEDFKTNFKQLIKWHQDLIESANILEIIYSKSTLLNFLSSSLIICLTGFNVTMINDVAIVVPFLSFLFMSLVQVFFLCFFADLLMISSAEISDALYNCQWYMAEAKVGKKILLMQTRCQEPCKLTAFGFADVNLNSFMRVLSTAWSYFALLQTMYGN